MGVGKNAWIGFALSTDYTTDTDLSASGVHVRNFLSESLRLECEYIFREGRNGLTYRSVLASQKAAGDLSLYVLRNGLEDIFEAAFGNKATTEVEAGAVYQHDFKLKGDALKVLTLDVNRDEAIYRYGGLKVARLTIEQAIDDFLKLEVSLVGRAEQAVASYTPSFIAEKTWSIDEINSFTIAGSTFSFRSWSLSLDFKIQDDRFTHTAKYPLEPVSAGAVEAIFRAEGFFNNSADYDSIVKATDPVAVYVEYLGDSIGTASQEKFILSLPLVRFRAETPTVGDEQGHIPFTVEGRALYDSSSGYIALLSITNETA